MFFGPRMRAQAALAILGCAAASQAGLVFDFSYDSGMDANAVAGFNAAGARWSSLFSDSITVNINIAFQNLGGNILGETWSNETSKSYSNARNALVADAKSADDAIAISSLQSGSSFQVKTNRWANSPNGGGSATAYTSTLNSLAMTTANAKALGLLSADDPANDASITFNSAYSYDFDPTNGISAGKIDFVGIATHEIGHALGFISGVDMVDYYGSSYNDNGFAWVNPLDLFRYKSGTTIPYLCADDTAKYFSLNGSSTSYLFANGETYGDGDQASHWKDNLGLGVMDPTANYGELLQISPNDIMAFDAIGYDTVPEPATMAGLALGVCAIASRRRRKK
jgi:hypothetical protein